MSTDRARVIESITWAEWYSQRTSKPPRGAGEWRSINCILPGHEDKTASARFSTKTGSLRCFGSCDEGKPFSPFDVAIKLGLAADFNSALQYFASIGRVVLADQKKRNGAPAKLEPLNELCLEYLKPQGVDLATAEAWALKYDPRRNALAIPRFRPDGMPAGNKYRLLAPPEGQSKVTADKGPPVLFGANRLGDATRVFVTEGEIDCIALASRLPPGSAAVGAPGAGVWKPEWSRMLDGLDVVMVFDADPRGVEGADKRATELHERRKARSVRVVDLRPLLGASGKDLGDFFGGGGEVGALLAAADATATWAPPADATPAPSPAVNVLDTDLGNARRLVARHGRDLRFCPALGGWLVWEGRRWAPDTAGKAMQRAKETIDGLFVGLATLTGDERDALFAHAKRSQSARALAAMVTLASTEPGIPIESDAFDRDPMLLNVQNGTVDLCTGELRPHHRDDCLSKLAAVQYQPAASCPTWDAFLRRIFADDGALISFMQRAAGYSLTGHTSEHALFLLYGTGRNGKSTFVQALQTLLGDYSRATPATALLDLKSERVRSDIARLRGARFVSAVEIDVGKRLAEALLKEATGGDPITAAFKFKDEFDFVPEFKIWMATNYKPGVNGVDEGIWSRIKLVPFTVTIPETERDKKLGAKLRAEAPGILAWALRGCAEWRSSGLGAPQAVQDATAAYRAESDPLGPFIEDCIEIDPNWRELACDIRAAYEKWCVNKEKPIGTKTFGQLLEARGWAVHRSHGKRYRLGVRLRVPGATWVPRSPEPSPDHTHAREDSPENAAPTGHPAPAPTKTEVAEEAGARCPECSGDGGCSACGYTGTAEGSAVPW